MWMKQHIGRLHLTSERLLWYLYSRPELLTGYRVWVFAMNE